MSTTTTCYQIAYDHAIKEIAEINEQILKLTYRQELLDKLLEPLKLLVPDSSLVAIPTTVSGGSITESPAAKASAQPIPAILVQFDPLEAPTPMKQPEVKETNVHASGNGHSISHEDLAGLAYRFWNERGQVHGHHEEDWFRAADELQNAAY